MTFLLIPKHIPSAPRGEQGRFHEVRPKVICG